MELTEEYIIGVVLLEIAEKWGKRILNLLCVPEAGYCIMNVSFVGFDYAIPIIPDTIQFNN